MRFARPLRKTKGNFPSSLTSPLHYYSVGDISTLIVYLKAQLETSGEPQFLFLDLVELTNGESADEIHKALVACLKRHGFDMDYLQEHFIAFTSDGASVLTGKKSGVMELLVKDFPNLITWHCLNHRLGLAVDDAKKTVKQSAMYEGLNKRIQSPEFLLDLALMCDVLFELSELSETLQHRSMNIVKADRCIKRSMRSIESLKRKTGTNMMIANDSVKEGKFGTVLLISTCRHVSVDANALIDKLLDAMRDRLCATNAAGTVRTSDAYHKLLDQVCVLYSTYWTRS